MEIQRKHQTQFKNSRLRISTTIIIMINCNIISCVIYKCMFFFCVVLWWWKMCIIILGCYRTAQSLKKFEWYPNFQKIGSKIFSQKARFQNIYILLSVIKEFRMNNKKKCSKCFTRSRKWRTCQVKSL